MASRDDDRILDDLHSVLFSEGDIEIPEKLLERMRLADRKLKEETSILKPLKEGFSSLLEPREGLRLSGTPAFAIEGDEDNPEEDPVTELLQDDE